MRAIEIPKKGGPLTLDRPLPEPKRSEVVPLEKARMMKEDARSRMVLSLSQ